MSQGGGELTFEVEGLEGGRRWTAVFSIIMRLTPPCAQVAVTLLCIAGGMRLVYVHRFVRSEVPMLATRVVREIQRFRQGLSSANRSNVEDFSSIINIGQLFATKGAFSGAPVPLQLQGLDMEVVLSEAAVSVLVDRADFLRLLIREVRFGVNNPYNSTTQDEDIDDRIYSEAPLSSSLAPPALSPSTPYKLSLLPIPRRLILLSSTPPAHLSPPPAHAPPPRPPTDLPLASPFTTTIDPPHSLPPSLTSPSPFPLLTSTPPRSLIIPCDIQPATCRALSQATGFV